MKERARKPSKGAVPKDKDIVDMKAIKKAEDIVPRRALEAVCELRDQPVISGLLMKQEPSWMGLGEKKWKNSYVSLDPTLGNLAYWDVNAATNKKQRQALIENSLPKQDYDLRDLIEIDTNWYHNTLMLNFCTHGNRKELGKSIIFQADDKEDFDRWVGVLSRYGMKEKDGPVVAARAA